MDVGGWLVFGQITGFEEARSDKQRKPDAILR